MGPQSAADGKAPGFPIPVFGVPHADIPLHDAAGPVIGELIVSSGISAVLDMGQMRKAEQARLVADLLDYLFTHNRDPLWLVLEEADAFAPQQPMGELTRVLGEVDALHGGGEFRVPADFDHAAAGEAEQGRAHAAFNADRAGHYSPQDASE